MKSIYFKEGIFHSGLKNTHSQLVNIRRSQNKRQGYERIVFDFSTKQVPRLYGHLSDSERKLYIDFFATTMEEGLEFPSNSRYVKNVNFFPLDKLGFGQEGPGMLSVEMKFKGDISTEIFHLSSPGRLVIDLKK